MCAPAVEEALLAQRLEEFGASPEGRALLGDEALHFGRHSFAEAVAAAQQPEDTTPAARGALVESLADGLKAAADGEPLRAAFFVSCHFLLNGGGPAQRGAAAQRLDLLTGSREAFSRCLGTHRRSATRAYHLLRSAAFATIARLDTAAPKGKRDKAEGEVKAATQSVVQEVLALPFAAQSLCSDAVDETISVLMSQAFQPELACLRQLVVDICGATLGTHPALAAQIVRAASSHVIHRQGKGKDDAVVTLSSKLVLQCAGASKECAAMVSVFLKPMVSSVFNAAAPAQAVRQLCDVVAACARAGSCQSKDALSVLLAASSPRLKHFDANTRARAVALAAAVSTSDESLSTPGRFLDKITGRIEQREWHAETKTVRLEYLKGLELVLRSILGNDAGRTQWLQDGCAQRLAAQMHTLLADVMTYEPAEMEQFLLAVLQLLGTLPPELIDISALLFCVVPVRSAEASTPREGNSNASRALLTLAAACLTADSDVSLDNWKKLSSQCAEAQACTSLIRGLQKLDPSTAAKVREVVANRAMQNFIVYAEHTRLVAGTGVAMEAYSHIQEMQLLACTSELFAELDKTTIDTLCAYLECSGSGVCDPAATKCVLVILKAAVVKNPKYRDQVMDTFRVENVVATFIQSGLHIELLDLFYSSKNRRCNGINLAEMMIEEAQVTGSALALRRLFHLIGELALRHCDRVKEIVTAAQEEIRKQEAEEQPDEEDGAADDEFNYMHREDQRREDAEALDESVSAVVEEGGPMHRFLPLITGVLSHQLLPNTSQDAAEIQASAVTALGKFMLCSRQLAETHVGSVAKVQQHAQHPLVRHAALAVLADMTMFIPNHAVLHRSDGQTVLTQLLDDGVLGRAALQQLLRLCSIRVVHATSHLGSIAAGLKHSVDEPSILAFFGSYLRSNTKRSGSSKARLLYKTYCELPQRLSSDESVQVMLRLVHEFCDPAAEKELTALLAKRLVEHNDSTAASLLYERRTASSHTVPSLVALIGQRKLAAFAMTRVTGSGGLILQDSERSDLDSALSTVQTLQKLMHLPAALKAMNAASRSSDQSGANSIEAAIDHLSHVESQFIAVLGHGQSSPAPSQDAHRSDNEQSEARAEADAESSAESDDVNLFDQELVKTAKRSVPVGLPFVSFFARPI